MAARGLDIFSLPAVINVDLPPASEDFIHRIGRTGRAGERGIAYTLVDETQDNRLRALERFLKITIDVEVPDAYVDFFKTHEKKLGQVKKENAKRLSKTELTVKQLSRKSNKQSHRRDLLSKKQRLRSRQQDLKRSKTGQASEDFNYLLPDL